MTERLRFQIFHGLVREQQLSQFIWFDPLKESRVTSPEFWGRIEDRPVAKRRTHGFRLAREVR